jgi:hypothetical protein
MGANSTQYSYLNGLTPKMGAGFDPSRPHTNFQKCLQLPSGSSDTNLGVASYSFSANLVTDSASLYKTLGIDVTLDASAEFLGSASTSTTFLQSIAVSSSDINWVLKVDQKYFPISVSPVGLEDFAQQWASQPQYLYNACGHEWVGTQTRGVSLVAIFSSHDLSTQVSQDLKTRFSAKLDQSFSGSFSLDASLRSFLTETTKHKNVNMSVYGFGGGGIQALAPLTITPTNINDVETVIQNYITTYMTADKAVPISFETGDFASYAVPPQPSPSIVVPHALEEMYLSLLQTEARQARVQNILLSLDSSYGFLSTADIAELNSYNDYLIGRIGDIGKAGKKCQADPNYESCTLPHADLRRIDWPQSPEPNCVLWDKDNKCSRCEQYISFVGKAGGSSMPFNCSHMPPQTTVEGKFLGYVVVDDAVGVPDTVSTWVTMQLDKIDATCDQCKGIETKASPAAGPKDYYWHNYCLIGKETTPDNGVASLDLMVNHCQFIATNVGCSTVPPANGLPEANFAPGHLAGQIPKITFMVLGPNSPPTGCD